MGGYRESPGSKGVGPARSPSSVETISSQPLILGIEVVVQIDADRAVLRDRLDQQDVEFGNGNPSDDGS